MSTVQIAVTTHALDRWISRVHPELLGQREEARRQLEVLVQQAAHLPEKTLRGEELWHLGDSLLVVARAREDKQKRIGRTVLRLTSGPRGSLPMDLQVELEEALRQQGAEKEDAP